MKKKIAVITGMCVIMVAVAVGLYFKMDSHKKEYAKSTNTTVSKAAEIDENFKKMSGMKQDTNTLLSSNPYDYVDNEYFDNIVAIGPDAIKILEEKHEKGEFSGLEDYIAAIAVERISGCSLNEVTGRDWESAEEFFSTWNTMTAELPKTFETILNSNKQVAEKVKELKKYGIFGESVAKKAIESKSERVHYCGQDVKCRISEKDKKELGKIVRSAEKRIGSMDAYLEAKMMD